MLTLSGWEHGRAGMASQGLSSSTDHELLRSTQYPADGPTRRWAVVSARSDVLGP